MSLVLHQLVGPKNLNSPNLICESIHPLTAQVTATQSGGRRN